MEFTKEQLIERCRGEIECAQITIRNGTSDTPNAVAERLELFEIALSSLNANPVYQYRERPYSEWMECSERYYQVAKEMNAEFTRILFTAPPAPAVPDGYALVPIDATRAMIDAASCVEEDGYEAMHKAMITAAPQPEVNRE